MEIHNHAGDISVNANKKSRRKKAKDVAIKMNGLQIDDQLQASKRLGDSSVTNFDLENNAFGTVPIVQPLEEHPKMDSLLAENVSKGNEKKKKRRQRANDAAIKMNGLQIDDQLEASKRLGGSKVANFDLENNAFGTAPIVQPLEEHPKMDSLLLENASKGNEKKKKRRQRANDAAIKMNGLQIDDQLEASKRLGGSKVANFDLENNAFGTVPIVQPLEENPKMDSLFSENFSKGNEKKKKKKIKKETREEAQSIDNKMDIESTENITVTNVKAMAKHKDKNLTVDQENAMSNLQLSNKTLRREILNQVAEHGDVQSTNQKKMDLETTNYLTEVNGNGKRERRRKKISSTGKNQDEGLMTDRANSIPNFQLSCKNLEEETGGKVSENENIQSKNQNKMNTESADTLAKDNSSGKKKRRKKRRSKAIRENMSIAPTIAHRRKLLVLDVNGLLADIVMPPPKDCRGDTHILGRAIFKRPFCNDFLKFCFQNFDVGIWSSRSEKVIVRIVDYLLGNLKEKLLFCWDMSHSTQTSFRTLENFHKPLVCKELRKIWENEVPNFCWKKEDYDESNTLLLDDSPYKALLNPTHTAIFPHSYHYKDKEDNSLGPGGDLRVYLEGFLASTNTREYVEQHPFGQSAINKTHISWQFYSRVLHTMSTACQA